MVGTALRAFAHPTRSLTKEMQGWSQLRSRQTKLAQYRIAKPPWLTLAHRSEFNDPFGDDLTHDLGLAPIVQLLQNGFVCQTHHLHGLGVIRDASDKLSD